QVVGVGKRSGVNRAQATRLDQLGNRRHSFGVIPSDEDIEGLVGHLALDQRPGKGGIERLDHAGPAGTRLAISCAAELSGGVASPSNVAFTGLVMSTRIFPLNCALYG